MLDATLTLRSPNDDRVDGVAAPPGNFRPARSVVPRRHSGARTQQSPLPAPDGIPP